MFSPKFLISLVLIALGAVFTAPNCYALDLDTLIPELVESAHSLNSYIDPDNYVYVCNSNTGAGDTVQIVYIYANSSLPGEFFSLSSVGTDSSDYISCTVTISSPSSLPFVRFIVSNGTITNTYQSSGGQIVNWLYWNNNDDSATNLVYTNISERIEDSLSTGFLNFYSIGGISSISSVSNFSEFNLFSSLFNIYFVPKSASNDNSIAQSMLDNRYPCYLVSVSSDNGYNMASLQCPALLQSSDTVFYGIFYLEPAKKPDLDIYQMTLSFASDVPLSQPDDPDFFIEPDSFFKLVVDTVPDITVIDNALSFTVNSMTFLNSNNAVLHYGSRTLKAFDFSSERDGYNIYSYWGTCNSSLYSAGSFIYNFNYTNILDVNDNNSPLDDDDIDKLKEEGDKKNTKKREDSPYVAKYNIYPDTSTGFVFPDNLADYDFRPLKSIFDALFNWYVLELLGISCTVGLIAYTLFGRGD